MPTLAHLFGHRRSKAGLSRSGLHTGEPPTLRNRTSRTKEPRSRLRRHPSGSSTLSTMQNSTMDTRIRALVTGEMPRCRTPTARSPGLRVFRQLLTFLAEVPLSLTRTHTAAPALSRGIGILRDHTRHGSTRNRQWTHGQNISIATTRPIPCPQYLPQHHLGLATSLR